MASGSTPHYHNSMGVPRIETGAKEFMCIGATPPFDHPHVFLDMGKDDEIICPYCSTLYKLEAKLRGIETVPDGCSWNGHKAA